MSVALLDPDVSVPLVVDLDGTFTLTDTLHESFARLLFINPLTAALSLIDIPRGRAVFKQRVTGLCPVDPKALPIRLELLELIQQERGRGRPVHLVTAANQRIADAFSAHYGVFDSAIGSDGERNLKGSHKLDHLRQHFAAGFLYAGDHRVDLPIFRASRGAILCDVDSHTRQAVSDSSSPILAEFQRETRGARPWLRLLRVHQWSKNALIFVPLIVGHAYVDPRNILLSGLAFLILCALASATYMLNDIADLEADRLHAVKRHRPFASGTFPIAFGLVGAPIIIGIALVAAYLLAPAFAATLLAYLIVTTAYSLGLKRVPMLDIFVIGSLFTLRIVMGTEVIGLVHSPWLLSFSLSFFVSLALAKRHGELMRAVHADTQEIRGRGYRADDWPLTLTFGVGIGMVSIVIMLLYMTNDAAPSGFYHRPGWLYAVPALVTLWLMRVWLLSQRAQLHDDPVVFAIKDRVSLGLGAATALIFLLSL